METLSDWDLPEIFDDMFVASWEVRYSREDEEDDGDFGLDLPADRPLRLNR